MGRFDGRVAVVTGAGSGIGREIALGFADGGGRVVCADRNGSEADTVATIGEAATAVHADVAVAADVEDMIRTAEDLFGRVDALFNNAGFGGPMMPLHEQTEENFDLVHSVNIRGVFLGMKYGITSMLRTGGGTVVNTASATGLVGWKNHSIYSAAKAGVIQLTKSAALDYASSGIRVNAICPGSTWTGLVPMSKEHPAPPPGTKAPFDVPMGRWGLAGEQAAAALFLASDESSFITGVALAVDGGYVIG